MIIGQYLPQTSLDNATIRDYSQISIYATALSPSELTTLTNKGYSYDPIQFTEPEPELSDSYNYSQGSHIVMFEVESNGTSNNEVTIINRGVPYQKIFSSFGRIRFYD